jgi:hypothetical protein
MNMEMKMVSRNLKTAMLGILPVFVKVKAAAVDRIKEQNTITWHWESGS